MCSGDDNLDPLVDLLRAVERFAVEPAVEQSPYELGERLIRLRHGIDLLELRFAREAAAFAATDDAAAQGSTSPIDWVRHQCSMSGNAAARAVATGEEAHGLPASVAALEVGRIGFAHLSLLAGTARAPRGPAGEAGFDERPLLDLAVEHSVSRFAFDCTHARHAADAAGVLAEHVNAVECRRLEMTRCEDGRIVIRGLLCSILWEGPRCVSRSSRSANPRVRATTVRALVAMPMRSWNSRATRSITDSPPTATHDAPIFNSPLPWRP